MSEESEENGTPIPGEMTPAEERATGNGWQPEEDWIEAGKEPADWVDAPEFNVRGELMGRIQGMGRKLNGYEKEIAELRATQKKHSEVTRSMVEATYKKAIVDLNRQRREAMEVGDYDQLDELDQRRDEMVEKRAEMSDEPTEVSADLPGPKQVHPIEQTFINIINSDPELQTDATKRGELGVYADTVWGANPDISGMEFTRKLDAHMNPQREAAPRGPAGAGGKRQPSRSKSKYTIHDLDEMEKGFANTFVETGAYETVQEYIDDAAKSGTLAVQQR